MLKNKEAAVNPKNTDNDNYFQYSITIALDHKNIGKDPQRISKIKSFITKYNGKGINFPAGLYVWKKIKQNVEIALNILYVTYNTEEICRIY